MPKDVEVLEDANTGSIRSFEDLRAYFDRKFSHLKCELSDDQAKSSSSLVKKLKSETNLTFKFSGNKKQFESNTEIRFSESCFRAVAKIHFRS